MIAAKSGSSSAMSSVRSPGWMSARSSAMEGSMTGDSTTRLAAVSPALGEVAAAAARLQVPASSAGIWFAAICAGYDAGR